MTAMSRCPARARRRTPAIAIARGAWSVIVPLALMLSACALQREPTPHHASVALAPRAETWMRTELYFGLSIPGGGDGSLPGQVNEEDWQRFLDQEVSPRFPDGLTILEVGGQWRSRPGDGHAVETVREQSRIVVIFYPADEGAVADGDAAGASADERIESVRAAYKRRFHQDSVLRTDVTLRVRF
jgi:hypothetical protein